jgi:hypothetical protein
MSDVVLYRNYDGKSVTHTSYSSRQTFRKCPREFQLSRVQGWRDKAERAAPMFGRCIESGLQAYEESGRTSAAGVKVFRRLWEEVKLTPDFERLIFTATEGNWEQLLKSGTELMLLYEIKAPHLPIVKPLFQQRIRKTIFPGTNLCMLENVAVLDILSFPPWDHKMLPKLDVTPENGVRELVIDIKTGGKDFPSDLVSLDPQLAEYAWQTRVPDVAFLYLIKASHGFKRGSRIALLVARPPLWAGWEGFVLDVSEDEKGAQALSIGSWDALQKYEAAVKGVRGKKLDELKQNLILTGHGDGSILTVAPSDVTKQRIQFAAARLTEEDMDEVGRSVAQTTVEMVRAHEQDFYEKQPGVRFPNEKCGFCSMRFHCLHDSEGRDKNLTRRGEEWLDGVDLENE